MPGDIIQLRADALTHQLSVPNVERVSVHWPHRHDFRPLLRNRPALADAAIHRLDSDDRRLFKNASLCHAIAQTFDGAHPCSLCRVVNKANSTEKKSDLQVLTPKVDMICPARGTTRLQPFVRLDYATTNFSVSEIRQSPAVPPPRSLLG